MQYSNNKKQNSGFSWIPGQESKLKKTVYFSLAGSIITGSLIGVLSPFYGLAAVIFVFFVSMTVYNINYGILFWIATGGFLAYPIYSFHTAGLYPSIIILSLLFIFWLFLSIGKGALGIAGSRLFWPLNIFIIATILSSLKGNILYDPNVAGEHYFVLVQIFASLIIIFSILTVFLIARFFKTAEQIRLIYSALIILGIELIIYDQFKLVKYGLSPPWFPIMQAHAMSICYSSLLFIPNLSAWKKIGLVIIMFCFVNPFIKEFFNPEKGQWLAGWIVLGIPVIFVTFQKSIKWGIYLLILLSALIMVLGSTQIEGMLSKAETERDYDRLIIWNTSFKMWSNNIIFGLGPGNYMDYALTYAPKGFTYTSAHNQYFQILTELGGVGFICFSWIIIRVLLLGRFLIRTVKDNFLKVFVIGIMGSIYGQLCTSVFADYILPSYHNGGTHNFSTTIYFWIMVGCLMAVEQIVVKEEQQVQGCRVRGGKIGEV